MESIIINTRKYKIKMIVKRLEYKSGKHEIIPSVKEVNIKIDGEGWEAFYSYK